MKAKAFLKLVGEMLTAQQDYYVARRGKRIDQYQLLVNAKSLERQVLAVVQEGALEPDDVPPTPKQTTLFE